MSLVVFMSGETCCGPSLSSFIVFVVVVVLSVFAPFTCSNERSSRFGVSLLLLYAFTTALQTVRLYIIYSRFVVGIFDTFRNSQSRNNLCTYLQDTCLFFFCFALFIAHFNSLAIYQCRKSKASS